jgi:predicted Zn-dependent protease
MTFTRTIVRPALLAALAGFSLAVSASSPALACGGEWYPEVQVDPRIQGVDKAEDAFEGGKILLSAASVVRMVPHIKTLSPTKFKLIQRATRVLAVATARYDGALPFDKEVPEFVQGTWLGKTDADRKANLEWAAKALREIAKVKDDPAAKTELGEALARLDDTRAEARTLLEDLAAKDLITSPEGYKALAQLRAKAGDDAGKRAALDRCRSMAHAAAVCEAPSVAT